VNFEALSRGVGSIVPNSTEVYRRAQPRVK
jgi:hypothetical protein